MPTQWTSDIIGQMHLNCIAFKELAKEVGWHEKYLSAVMNGHRNPKEARGKLTAALDQLIAKRRE